MCGRYSLFTDYSILLERFNIEESAVDAESYFPNYNVAPSQQIMAVVNDKAKEAKIGYKIINARAETASKCL